jgi:thioester reductase-like protein
MPVAKRILITGATGFLGSHLAYDLLVRGHNVVALVRPSDSESPADRIRRVLGQVPSDPAEANTVLDRLEVAEGDIAAPWAGLDTTVYRNLCDSVDEVWHVAASLSFIEEHRAEIFRMNVDGTRNIVELAAKTSKRRLHHVSTAYVAGMRTGVAYETETDVGQKFRNPYEESKCSAETIIRKEHETGNVVLTVYRPSVVIGESVTGRATHLHGVYAFIRGLWSVVERIRKKTGQDIVDLPLRVRGSGTGTLNFVPIDYVTAAMLHIGSLDSSPGQTYHMTNPEATENSQWLGVVCQRLGVRGIELVSEDRFEAVPMTRMEAIFHRQMAFYYQYLAGEPRFDPSSTLGALEGTRIKCPEVSDEFNHKMTGWYIDRLNAERDPQT